MKVLPKIIFVVYILILMKLILFKGPVFYEVVPTQEGYIEKTSDSSLVAVNLRPFASIMNYFGNDSPPLVVFFNVFGNILLFIPYGFLLPLIFKSRVILFDVFYSAFLLSVSFELYQLVTRTGQLDIDDVILNTTGGMIGYLLLRLTENIAASIRYRRRPSSNLSKR